MEKINYNWSSNDSHSDSIVNSEDGYEAMIGDKGSIIFVDTVSCFHRGSRMQKEDRLILEAHYLSRTSFRYPPINWLFPKFISKKFLILSNPLLRIDKDMSFIDSNALNI